ncbi:pentatricopeptide repeat-containing protein At5g27110-like [Selaginella moellendorffii]|uniref:pentatricopeptide repeat-containing protein At5g27110-like n=1 Tax=Selaginella moellendorffii TaxID=88036 RepID=UPI000D1CA446|nr:pentatricopeptide repeat-containing protein At5g27110-like [Selaginella moellendorffii]|eukprot:XP_024545069.1 pentatricopeptide repeat-containing protein At5g27110-like [Selaginella moellendorffii]
MRLPWRWRDRQGRPVMAQPMQCTRFVILHRSHGSGGAQIENARGTGISAEARDFYEKIRLAPTIPGYIAAIKACSSSRDLLTGDRIHGDLRASAMIDDPSLASSLVEMYGRCGSVARAREVFDAIQRPSLASWSSMVMACAHSGHGELALEFFSRMEDRGLRPDARCFIAALKACAILAEKEKHGTTTAAAADPARRIKATTKKSLERGMALHSQLQKLGLEEDIFVASTLVDMYAKCGSMASSRAVFERMAARNTVAWNAIIMGYAQAGAGCEALELFARMQHEGTLPDSRTFVAAFKACMSLMGGASRMAGLSRAMAIHGELEKLGLVASNTYLANSVMDMYSKLGRMADARKVFDGMRSRSLVSWNTLIAGYGQSGDGAVALAMFSRMRDEGLEPDALTFIAVINACALLAAREEGTLVGRKVVKPVSLAKGVSIHSQAGRHELENTFVANSLVDMYAKCGSLDNARRVFDRMPRHTTVSWNSMITGYVQGGEPETALTLLEVMRDRGFVPDARTYLAAVNAVASLADREEPELVEQRPVKLACLERGLETHSRLARAGFQSDKFVASALVDMYSKCGSMADAQRVFDRMPHRDSVCWTVLILGYALSGDEQAALELLSRMHEEGYTPNALTYAAALNACMSLASREAPGRCLELAAAIHSQISKSGCESDVLVASTLVGMYCKCGSLVDARRVFDRMERHDVVSWTTLMLGYVQAEQAPAALDLFSRMQQVQGLVPDAPTYAAALRACGSSTALETGRAIHQQIRHAEMEAEVVVVNSLLGFYGRCGCMAEACEVFDSAASAGRDAVTWNAIIAGYCHQGDVASALRLFERMLEDHWQPDGVTFLSLLTACCHAGLVDKGKELFRLMVSDYAIVPGIEHYSCAVDLLGRANQVDEALAVVTSIPVAPDLKLWMTVLDACGKWSNWEAGRVAFESIQLLLDHRDHSAAYVLMSRTYLALELEARDLDETWKNASVREFA